MERSSSGSRKRKKRWKHRKKIIIAYTLRSMVAVVLFGMFALMVCGCLFVAEHLDSSKAAMNENIFAGAGLSGEEQPLEEKEGLSKEQFSEGATKSDYSGCSVVLDAGHGGQDGGTYNGGIYEKEINLQMVNMLQRKLEEYGITVIHTRTQDVSVTLDERVKITNHSNADLFVSIHCNSYEDDKGVFGFQCYYDKKSEAGKVLAERITEQVKNGGLAKVRDAKSENYQVTRNAKIPAVLIELGYLTNDTEREDLASKDYLEALAEWIVLGILEQLDNGKEIL